ncbi:hypothetical protein DCS_07819 [Drechmeria coniospora]|uniref:Uncharacterized protein n=1 Tax=Drechmeria coniospora TaxID=98403 RepID=A0A151GFJ2_DRECN|nr:hypothetical protein DCS_07819 [Drechmeria coniospora]KYK55854.1 hypothetical protein DCS_07819 [Drechmeria coniospora]
MSYTRDMWVGQADDSHAERPIQAKAQRGRPYQHHQGSEYENNLVQSLQENSPVAKELSQHRCSTQTYSSHHNYPSLGCDHSNSKLPSPESSGELPVSSTWGDDLPLTMTPNPSSLCSAPGLDSIGDSTLPAM